MIKKLIIKNYALIDELEIDFGNGMSIITGETGAGKSIILGALGLLLGDRADAKAMADKSRKTIVEAIFELKRPSEEGASELPETIELIARREILPSGRSRAFVDDSPVTLVKLQNITSRLLDIHSQHANLSLTSPEGQLKIIDAMADNSSLLADYREVFRNYIAVRNRLRKLKEQNEQNNEKRGALEYQLGQLKKLNVKLGEQEKVEKTFELLNDADEIRENLKSVSYLLLESESSALNNISSSIHNLEEISNLIDSADSDEVTLQGRLKEIAVELKDIAETAGRRAGSIESNPVMLAKTASRMKDLYDATKAFHVAKADDLVALREKLEQDLKALTGDDSEISGLERDGRQLASALKELASQLSGRRARAAEIFSRELTERARQLGLPNLRFEVGIAKTKITVNGQESIEFLCAFNKNGAMLPMASTASGGELSRLTLTIKSMMAEKMEMPSVIFDEVDTGVSGEIAAKMGAMMNDMAKSIQILAITHLPQVAAKGERHYKVTKHDTEERTISTVTELSPEERVKEIAGMLSGERLSDAALEAARVLIEKSNE